MQESGTRHILTREQLYEAVWRRPMRHVAKDYGLSDVGLAKLCRRHQIPTPPLGYWAKLQHGKAVPRPDLPTVDDPSLDAIVIEPVIRSEYRDRTPKPEVTVPTELTSPHALIQLTAKALRKTKVDDQGLLRPTAPPALPIAVGRHSVDRALRLLDTLFKALETRGYPVAIDTHDRSPSIVATVNTEPISFALAEALKREERNCSP